MPVVPRIESPPTMPRRPLRVFAASASPPGMAISTSTSPARLRARGDLRDGVADHRRGTGLMAGSPGGIGRPGTRDVPTPAPARKVTPLPGAPARTVATIKAPWVTSGSSPASLITPALAEPASRRVSASAKATVRRAARSPRPDREIRRSAAPHRRPWPRPWRRRRWSSPGAADDPVSWLGGHGVAYSPRGLRPSPSAGSR